MFWCGREKAEITDEPVKVYNFKVDDFHTYHVGKKGILVHNADYNPKWDLMIWTLRKLRTNKKAIMESIWQMIILLIIQN